MQEFVWDGNPLKDIARIHLLPIYETLPNRDKQLTGKERYDKYLEPFFLGRFQLVEAGKLPFDCATVLCLSIGCTMLVPGARYSYGSTLLFVVLHGQCWGLACC